MYKYVNEVSDSRRTDMNDMTQALAALFVACGLVSAANAQYTLTPSVAGLDSVQVVPGESVLVEMNLTGPAGVQHDAALFDLSFSAPGLRLTGGYAWGGAYTTNGVDDISDVSTNLSGLPFEAPAGDVHFENAFDGASLGLFETGTLMSITVAVAADYAGPDTITIGVNDVVFADSTDFFNSPTGSAGPDLTLRMVPEPATLALAGALLLVWRRRRIA